MYVREFASRNVTVDRGDNCNGAWKELALAPTAPPLFAGQVVGMEPAYDFMGRFPAAYRESPMGVGTLAPVLLQLSPLFYPYRGSVTYKNDHTHTVHPHPLLIPLPPCSVAVGRHARPVGRRPACDCSTRPVGQRAVCFQLQLRVLPPGRSFLSLSLSIKRSFCAYSHRAPPPARITISPTPIIYTYMHTYTTVAASQYWGRVASVALA